MLEMIMTMIVIAAICVMITDITGAMEDMAKPIIWRLLKGKQPYKHFDNHLLDCSLCQSHWVNLIYLCFANGFSLYGYAIVLLIAIFTPVIKDTILLIKEFLSGLINQLFKLTDKLNR